MWKQPENDQFVDELYLAGERVSAGTYRQVGGSREVMISAEGDTLPASLDGRVAAYMRVQYRWCDMRPADPLTCGTAQSAPRASSIPAI